MRRSGLLSHSAFMLLISAVAGHMRSNRAVEKNGEQMSKLREGYRSMRRWLIRSTRRPRVGHVQLGDLDRLTPISRDWGFDRGRPIDRLYIERFIAAHAGDIRGDVLEVSNNDYTVRFGGAQVTRSDILHYDDSNPRATVVANLAVPNTSLEGRFDCIICTQTLQFIYDFRSAVTQLHRWLKPGGVALVTVPCISQISREDMQQTGDYWRFTVAAVRRMFAGEFGDDAIAVDARGNVLAATAFLHGIAAEELDEADLLEVDPQFQMLTTVRAVRQKGS
jgi:SAM-dependent methyltransferase